MLLEKSGSILCCHMSCVTWDQSRVTCHLFTTRHSVRPCLTLRFFFPISKIKRFAKCFLKKWRHFVSQNVMCHLSPVRCHLITTGHSVRPCLTLRLCFPISQIKRVFKRFLKSGAILFRHMSCVTCHLSPVIFHLFTTGHTFRTCLSTDCASQFLK